VDSLPFSSFRILSIFHRDITAKDDRLPPPALAVTDIDIIQVRGSSSDSNKAELSGYK